MQLGINNLLLHLLVVPGRFFDTRSMSDHRSRYISHSSYLPSPTSFVTQPIVQIFSAFGIAVFVFVGILHSAPQNIIINCAAALPTQELPTAFIPFASSRGLVELEQQLSRIRVGPRRRFVPSHLVHARMKERNDMDINMNDHHGKEIVDSPPLRSMNNDAHATNDTILSNDGEDDDASEDNSPRRGRPGIVVFSGGTAFNAASAEMASRSTSGSGNNNLFGGRGGDDDNDDVEGISRSNSMSNFVDMLAMGSMETVTSTRSDIHQSNNIAPGGGGLKVWHVLPVTDDGGSTAEIVRVLGGPAVGDIRSRLLRLAPGTTREARAVRRLLGHRLVSMQSLEERDLSENGVTNESVSRMAREEWLDILDGGIYQEYQDDRQNYEHPLWKDVSSPYRSVSVHI